MDQDQNTERGNDPRSDRPDKNDQGPANRGSANRPDSEPRFGRPTPTGSGSRFSSGPARNNDRRSDGPARPERSDNDRRPAGKPSFGRDNSDKPRFNRPADDRPRSFDRGSDSRSSAPRRDGGSFDRPSRPVGNDTDRPRFGRPSGPPRFGKSDNDRGPASRDTDSRGPSVRRSGGPAGGSRFSRNDSDKPRFPRRDDDSRSRNDGPRNDRPRFDKPRFDGPSSDKPRFDGPRDGASRDDKPRFDRSDSPRDSRPERRNDDRRDDRSASGPSSFRPRPADSDDRRPAFRPRPDSGDDKPRFPRRDNDSTEDRGPARFVRQDDADGPITDPIQAERPTEDRPRFERRDENGRGRPNTARFEQTNARPTDRRDDDSDRRTDNPTERPTRFERDADRPDTRRDIDRRDSGSRSPFGRPPARPDAGRSNDRPERRPANPRFDTERPRPSADRPSQRDDDRNAPPSRYSDEQQQDSRERKVGRYDRAPDYNFERMQDRVPPRKRGETGPKRERTYAEDGLLRLNRYIANAGVCSRREADDLIARGDVSVNGKVVTEMGYKVKSTDVVRYGSRVLNPEKLVYVLLNKPKDYITTTDDPQERQTVMDLVADAGPFRLYPVGRLDRNTTGLLLLTNDGELADKLTHPSHQVKKIYQAEIDKPITEEHFQMLRDGFDLEDGPVKPDDVGIVTPDAQVIGIEIHSGRNRIVRRMFEHLGYDVTKLDRTVYASLTKKDLPRGKWRFLEPKEVVKLKYLQ